MPPSVQFCVAMNLWYGFDKETGRSVGGLGFSHWNSDAIDGTGFHDSIAVKPEVGFYASDDPQVIAQQLQWMVDAGIDCIITSWWGWGDDDSDGEVDNPGREAIDRSHRALFDHLKSIGAPIKVAIGMDNFMIPTRQWGFRAPVRVDQTVSQAIWDRIYENYVLPYHGVYFQWQDKPLVTGWMPAVLADDKANRFTHKKIWPLTLHDPLSDGEQDWSWIALFKHPDDAIARHQALCNEYFRDV